MDRENLDDLEAMLTYETRSIRSRSMLRMAFLAGARVAARHIRADTSCGFETCEAVVLASDAYVDMIVRDAISDTDIENNYESLLTQDGIKWFNGGGA